MDLIDQVKERLSIFKNFYDIIRIVDPVKKKTTIIIDNKIQELDETCYALWKKDMFCKNCISMRAYINNDTFIKIECDKEKIILITATPIEIDGNVFIAEILKDITQNGSVLHKLTEGSNFVEELISSINEKAIKDDLTGLYNRRYINERLPIDINYNKINKLPLSVIMADIDCFKKVNDMYGHVNGDKILIDFSNLILKSIKNNIDWVGRYGGEEFIIVLNGTELKNAYTVAEKIRKQLENTTFNYDGININITASFGIYCITDYDMETSELLSKVDKSLYDAKRSGRNTIVMSQGDVNGVSAIDVYNKYIKLSNLSDKINELRVVLNEICSTLDAGETNPDRLIISKCLDELIVEYMKEINNLK
jgi:two-component system, cell cycle response regulator